MFLERSSQDGCSHQVCCWGQRSQFTIVLGESLCKANVKGPFVSFVHFLNNTGYAIILYYEPLLLTRLPY